MMLSSEYLTIMIMIGERTIVIVMLGDLAVATGQESGKFLQSSVCSCLTKFLGLNFCEI